MKPKTRDVKLKHPLPDITVDGFGVDPGDSRKLLQLRVIIDNEIGWRNEEQEEAADYDARLREVAAELRELREENHRLGLIAEEHDCLAFPWDDHAPSRRDARVRQETLERAAKVLKEEFEYVDADTIERMCTRIRSLASHDTGGGG